jgi:hypothetical protein
LDSTILFPEKEAKSVSSASQTVYRPVTELGEAHSGGLGACPKKTASTLDSILLFPEKEAKSVSSASQNELHPSPWRSRPKAFGGYFSETPPHTTATA